MPSVALPISAHVVAILAIPFRPQDGEVADLVSTFAHVPGLGDQLHRGNDRVLMDAVEEAGEPAHVVKLPREGGGEIEAEAIDVHLADPVTEAVHQELKHPRMHHVQRVSRAGVIHVVAPVILHEAVVGAVIQAAETEHRPQMVPFTGVIVHDIQNDLETGGVQPLDHLLELGDLFAGRAALRIGRVRSEVPDRVVTPIVGESLLFEKMIVHEVMHRQQLDRRDSEFSKVIDGEVAADGFVSSADFLRNVRALLGEAFDVDLVDDGFRLRHIEQSVPSPIECIVDDDTFGHAPGIVAMIALEIRVGAAVHHVAEHFRTPVHQTGHGLRIWVQEKFRCIEAVPDVIGAFEHSHPQRFLGRAQIVEEAEIHSGGVLGEEREVNPFARHRGAEGIRAAFPDLKRGHLWRLAGQDSG